jgi:hypothetical protein
MQRTGAVRSDAQAYVVVDTSTSMLARPSRTASARIDVARRVADRVAERLPRDVPLGLAIMPQGLLPVVVPTNDRSLYRGVLDRVVKVGAVPIKPRDQFQEDRPTSPQPFVATSLIALRTLDLARFFSAGATHRLVVLVTDGESAAFAVPPLTTSLARMGMKLLVVRVGSDHDRLWRPIRGRIVLDPDYKPQTESLPSVLALARSLGGSVYGPHELAALSARARELLGRGGPVRAAKMEHVVSLGPYFALAAIPLTLLLLAESLPALALPSRHRAAPARQEDGSSSRSRRAFSTANPSQSLLKYTQARSPVSGSHAARSRSWRSE